jgi:hypothetical protein
LLQTSQNPTFSSQAASSQAGPSADSGTP